MQGFNTAIADTCYHLNSGSKQGYFPANPGVNHETVSFS